MSSASDIRAGGAFIEILGDDSSLKATLKSAKSSMESFGREVNKIGTGLAVAGAAITAPLGLAIREAMDEESALAALSTAITNSGGDAAAMVPRYVKFANALEEVSTVANDTTLALILAGQNLGMSGSLEDASKAALGLARAFGMDAQSALKGYALAQQGTFTLLARQIPKLRAVEDRIQAQKDALVELQSAEHKAALAAVELAGKQDIKAIQAKAEAAKNALKGMSAEQRQAASAAINDKAKADIEAVKDRMIEQKDALSGLKSEQLKAAEAAIELAAQQERMNIVNEAATNGWKQELAVTQTFGGQLKQLQNMMKRLAEEIGGPLIEALKPALASAKEWILKAIEWVKNNGDLIVSIGKVGVALLAMGAAAKAIGSISEMVSTLIGPAGPFVLLATAVLLVADAMGVVNLGLTEMIGNFRVGGMRIQTWIGTTWETILIGWTTVSEYIQKGVAVIVNIFTQAWNVVKLAAYAVFAAVETAFIAMIKTVALGLNTLIEGYNAVAGLVSQDLTIGWKWDTTDMKSYFVELTKGTMNNIADEDRAHNQRMDNITKEAAAERKRHQEMRASMYASDVKQPKGKDREIPNAVPAAVAVVAKAVANIQKPVEAGAKAGAQAGVEAGMDKATREVFGGFGSIFGLWGGALPQQIGGAPAEVRLAWPGALQMPGTERLSKENERQSRLLGAIADNTSNMAFRIGH